MHSLRTVAYENFIPSIVYVQNPPTGQLADNVNKNIYR